MADCAALEMLCAGNRTGGSNPPLSAQGPWLLPGSFAFSAMAFSAVLLCFSNLLFAQANSIPTAIVADRKTFDETVAPFLRKYCASCHEDSSNESGVVLSGISFDLAAGVDMELWNTVLRQLHLEEMPPSDSLRNRNLTI